jgi:hypothetical protein
MALAGPVFQSAGLLLLGTYCSLWPMRISLHLLSEKGTNAHAFRRRPLMVWISQIPGQHGYSAHLKVISHDEHRAERTRPDYIVL